MALRPILAMSLLWAQKPSGASPRGPNLTCLPLLCAKLHTGPFLDPFLGLRGRSCIYPSASLGPSKFLPHARVSERRPPPD